MLFRSPQTRGTTGTQVVELKQAISSPGAEARSTSYNEAVKRAVPAVVNVFTSKEVRAQRHPLLDDPLFRRFFGDSLPEESQRATSLGSGVIVRADGTILTNEHVILRGRVGRSSRRPGKATFSSASSRWKAAA